MQGSCAPRAGAPPQLALIKLVSYGAMVRATGAVLTKVVSLYHPKTLLSFDPNVLISRVHSVDMDL